MIISEITMTEFENGLNKTKSVIIPVGSTEEHGDHLPLGTDIMQAYEAAKMVSKKVPIFVTPPIFYGICRSTNGFPGTIAISPDCLRMLIRDIVISLYENGLRNFIITSGHAGGTHMCALQEVAEQLMYQLDDAKFMVLNDFHLAYEVGFDANIWETEGDSHAGEVETSRMMAYFPELIKGEGKEEYPNFPTPIMVRNKRKFWPGGIWGNPLKASKEKGLKVNYLIVEKLIQLIRELEEWQE